MNTSEIKRENYINLYNEKGEKHGVWESYYDNGQLFYRGNYVNGQRHGLWESYYPNGQLHYQQEYNMGKEVKPVVELTMDEIAKKFGISVSELKIKK